MVLGFSTIASTRDTEEGAGSSGPTIRTIWVVLVLAAALLPVFPVQVHGPAASQPSTFFLHKQSSKTVNTITSSLWANTTQLWPATTQTELRSAVRNSPAIWDYYSEPALAGNVTFTGPLTFILYLSASASTGSGTVITGTVSKITSTGIAVPLAVASLSNAPITTTVSVYTLTIVSNTYQIEAGAIFDLTITISIPGNQSRTITLYYDAPSYRSQVSITFQSRLGITYFASYNQTGVQTSFFSRNWTATGQQVTLRAVLFDAMGLYDVAFASTNITSPTGSSILSNAALTKIQGTGQDYTGTWALNVTYSNSDTSGAYTSNLSVVDNNAVSVSSQISYMILAYWGVNMQTISQDSTPTPLPSVSVTVSSGGVPIYIGTTNASGWTVPANILLRDNTSYAITAFWQGYLVNQTLAYSPSSPSNIQLYSTVYRVDFSRVFRDGNGNVLPQPPTGFQLTYPNGSVANPNPSASYLLPTGTYSLSSILWKGVDVTPATTTFNPRNGAPSLGLQIYDMTITVVDQDGRTISGAKVTVSLAGQALAQGSSGSDGTLVVRNLPKGQYDVQVEEQSQTTRTAVDLNQNTSSRVQVNITTSTPWFQQTWGWMFLVGAAVGGLLGYRQISRSRLAFKEEAFEYLDKISGGFRSGDVVLIEGEAGTGRTTICEQIAYKSLAAGDPVIFLTYDSAETVRESMKRFRWDPSPYEAKQSFQLVSCELSAIEGGDHSFGALENFYDITTLSMSISSAFAQLSKEKPVLLIDSLTQLAERASLSGLVNLILETALKVKKLQGQMFLTIGRSVPKTALGKLEESADSVIELSPVVENGKILSELRVRKMKGRKFDNRPVRMRVDPKKGIVFQMRRAIRAPR